MKLHTALLIMGGALIRTRNVSLTMEESYVRKVYSHILTVPLIVPRAYHR